MIDSNVAKHVQGKLHEEQMKEQRLSTTILVPIAEKENTVSDEELIKFVVQEELSKKIAEKHLFKLIENARHSIDPPPYKITYCYGEYQRTFARYPTSSFTGDYRK